MMIKGGSESLTDSFLSRLLELDGRKSFPIDHGPTSQPTLLQVERQAKEIQTQRSFLHHLQNDITSPLSIWKFARSAGTTTLRTLSSVPDCSFMCRSEKHSIHDI